MYVGSETGIVILAEQGGAWHCEGKALAGQPINVVAAPRGANIVYACVPREGVFTSEDAGQSWAHPRLM